MPIWTRRLSKNTKLDSSLNADTTGKIKLDSSLNEDTTRNTLLDSNCKPKPLPKKCDQHRHHPKNIQTNTPNPGSGSGSADFLEDEGAFWRLLGVCFWRFLVFALSLICRFCESLHGCLTLSLGVQFGIWFGGLAFPFPGPSPVPASLPNTPCLIPRGNSFETKTNIRIQKQQNRTHSSTKNNITQLKHQKMPIETQLQSMQTSHRERHQV